MADGNAPSRGLDLNDLLYQAQETFARIHEHASRFSDTLDSSNAKLREFTSESKQTGAIRRMDELNTESEGFLRATQEIANSSKTAFRELQENLSSFDRLDAQAKRSLVQKYAAQAAELKEKAAVFHDATRHLEAEQQYLSRKADQLDDYDMGAGDDLRAIAKSITAASFQADDVATSTRYAHEWIDRLAPQDRNNLLNFNESAHTSEEAAELFEAAKRENNRLRKEIESTEQKLRQQHQEAVDRMTDENMADPEVRRRLENDQAEIEFVMSSVAGWKKRIESEAANIRRLEQKPDLGEFATPIAEDTFHRAKQSSNQFTAYGFEMERVFQLIQAPLPSPVKEADSQTAEPQEPAPTPEPPVISPPIPSQPVEKPAPEIIDNSQPTTESAASPDEQQHISDALQKLREERVKETATPPPEKPSFEIVDEAATPANTSEAPISQDEQAQIADALAALKKNREASSIVPPAKSATEEKPLEPETKTPPPPEPNSAAIASAIQNTLGPIPPNNASGTVTTQEQKTISETRAELKEQYAVRQHETEILKLYSERMRTRSMEYLQTHDPVRYTQVQETQTQVGTTTTIDATVFLQTSELQTVHLLALTDVRATFSDATDELMSQILLAQATSQMALPGTVAQGAQTLGAATAGALASTGIAVSGLASAILTKADQTRQALQREEENLAARASQLRAASSSTVTANAPGRTSPANLDTLRNQQQAGATARRGLQAGLHSQMQSAQTANQLSNALGKHGSDAPTAVQQQAMVGVLDLLEGRAGLPRRPSSSGSTQPSSRGTAGTSQSIGKTADSSSRDQGVTSSDASRAAHEADLASRLQAGKLRDRRMAEIEQTEVGSSRIGGGGQGLLGNSSDQILQTQGSRRPISQREVFAEKQRAMSSRSQSFLGVGAVAGGFEAAFDESSVDDRGNRIEVEDGDLLPLEDEEAQHAAMEEQRVAEFQAEQQRARQSNDNTQKKQNALDTIQKGKNLLNNKTVAQNSKLLLNPYVLAAVVIILFFWLNIRLFFSNEESSWRKPLGGWGKIGTVAFDLALVLSFLITFLLMISTILLPLLPALLAIGGVSATISHITH
ncbi:hypothetical protein KBB27_00510 [Patescibacteria group bacterium]|nr:hypothetical protein [Patescibacteria group bacterium]